MAARTSREADAVARGAQSIERRPVDALIPYAKNARTPSDGQIGLIAGSIREFGVNNTVLVDGENGIIAGHQRMLTARKLALETGWHPRATGKMRWPF